MMDVERLVARFEDGTLPKADWTHRAHLTVALWYATRLPFEEALAAVRKGIQAVNTVHGVVTTPFRGYHETITRFYMLVVCDYVRREELERETDWGARVDRLLARYGARDLPLRHYSKDRLMSAEARFGWVEPDLLPIGGAAVLSR